MTHKDECRVAAVVLAAGGSSRFGSPKQLALWQGSTFIETVVDAALASLAAPVLVVLGAQAEACTAQLGSRPVTLVPNPNWAAGQSTSLKAGLTALPDELDAALFLLVDQPLVTARVIDQLIDRYCATRAPVVWPEFDGQRGNPILFDRVCFAEMNTITGDTGARPILQRYREQAIRVAVDTPGVLQDFDRPEDLPPAT